MGITIRERRSSLWYKKLRKFRNEYMNTLSDVINLIKQTITIKPIKSD